MRPPTERIRRLTVRLTEDELEELTEVARQYGCTVSDLVRAAGRLRRVADTYARALAIVPSAEHSVSRKRLYSSKSGA